MQQLPLKYLSNFWKSLEIPLINCKVEFRLKWTNSCVLSAAVDNINGNDGDNNIISLYYYIYIPVISLSVKDNKKLSKLLSKGFEKSVYWNEYETKIKNQNTTNEFRYFLEPHFVSVSRLFIGLYK